MKNSLLQIKRFAFGGAALAFIVILLGVATRLMDAGLGCPDWPGCYGQLFVPDAATAAAFSGQPLEPVKAWMEMVHRYIASLLGAVAIALVVLAFFIRQYHPQLFSLSLLLLLSVSLQGVFGMLTVTLKLWPVVVTLHLLGGLSCMALFAWLGWYCSDRYRNSIQPKKQTRQKINPFYWFALIVLIGQIALGGWTSSNYAGVGCIGFPECNGEWLPPADFSQGFHLSQEIGPDYLHGQLDATARTAIHLVHRGGALLLGIALLLLYLQQKSSESEHRHIVAAVLIFYLIQLVVAVLLIYWSLPLLIALLHTAVAALIFLTLLYGGYVGVAVRHPSQQNTRIKGLFYEQQSRKPVWPPY